MSHPRAAICRYLEAGLPPRAEKRLRRHLQRCERCRREYDEGVALLRALTGRPDQPTPEEIERSVARALAAVTPPQTATESMRARGERGWAELVEAVLWSPQRAVAGVVAVLLIAVGVPWGIARWAPAATLTRGTNVTVDGKTLAQGARVRRGARIAVATNGIAELDLVRGGTLRVFPGTEIEIGRRGERVGLRRGRLWCVVDAGHGDFVVRTPSGEARVLGTSFVVEHDADRGTTDVRVMEGRVRVSGRDEKGDVVVGPGLQTHVSQGAAPTVPTRYDAGKDRSDWENFLQKLWRDITKAVRDLRDRIKAAPAPEESK